MLKMKEEAKKNEAAEANAMNEEKNYGDHHVGQVRMSYTYECR